MNAARDNPNRLIALLPAREQARLAAGCTPVQLELGTVLCEAGDASRHVYFPADSFISLVTRIEGEPGLEVGMIGNEGMLGAQLALGVATTPLHALVQGAGTAQRMDAKAFRGAVAQSPALRETVLRYLYVLMGQLATAAACTRFHRVGPRMARWLLMSQDRAGCDHFHLTHEFLACMLGVRRVGITAAAGDLHDRGLISYRRGEVSVLDRPGLEAAACSCYASDRSAYERVLGR